MQFTLHYLRSDEISQKFKQVCYMLSENIKDRIRTTFGFNLCTTPLQVILVTYFRRGHGELRGLEPPEDSKACYC